MSNLTLEQRFNNVVFNYGRGRFMRKYKKPIKGKNNQVEFCYLVDAVQRYGFEFEPELYVAEYVERLEELVKNQ